jgi:hypothetical protein
MSSPNSIKAKPTATKAPALGPVTLQNSIGPADRSQGKNLDGIREYMEAQGLQGEWGRAWQDRTWVSSSKNIAGQKSMCAWTWGYIDPVTNKTTNSDAGISATRFARKRAHIGRYGVLKAQKTKSLDRGWYWFGQRKARRLLLDRNIDTDSYFIPLGDNGKKNWVFLELAYGDKDSAQTMRVHGFGDVGPAEQERIALRLVDAFAATFKGEKIAFEGGSPEFRRAIAAAAKKRGIEMAHPERVPAPVPKSPSLANSAAKTVHKNYNTLKTSAVPTAKKVVAKFRSTFSI